MSDGDSVGGMNNMKPLGSTVGMSQADMLGMKQTQDSVAINEAIDEFVQDKKSWFTKLYKKHGDDVEQTAKELGNEFMKGTAKFIGRDVLPIEDSIGAEEEHQIVKKITLANEMAYAIDADKRLDPDWESSQSEEDPEDHWDAETILTTYTNTDNHPSVIKFVPKVKVNAKARIELDTKFKVPIDGLNGLIEFAEEIRPKRKT